MLCAAVVMVRPGMRSVRGICAALRARASRDCANGDRAKAGALCSDIVSARCPRAPDGRSNRMDIARDGEKRVHLALTVGTPDTRRGAARRDCANGELRRQARADGWRRRRLDQAGSGGAQPRTRHLHRRPHHRRGRRLPHPRRGWAPARSSRDHTQDRCNRMVGQQHIPRRQPPAPGCRKV
jgi:hypothetical protein